jgi:hypothetical protein
MTALFWKALEERGACGAAASDWKLLLGDDFERCSRLLRPTGRTASLIAHRESGRRLSVVPGWESEFDAIDEDDPGFPPVPCAADDVEELAPDWREVAAAVAGLVRFDQGAWENTGHVRRIGSSQDSFGRVSPVLLFMPSGGLGDYQLLIRELLNRPPSTILFPTARWFTAEIEALRVTRGHAFVDLSRQLEEIESSDTSLALPPLQGSRNPTRSTQKAILHGGSGLTWSDVRIEVASGRTIYLSAPSQPPKPYRFPATIKLDGEHAVGMLMRLAVHGEWRNPSKSSPDYDRVSKAFNRLQNVLRALVPLPGELFTRMSGAYVPVFAVGLHPSLGPQRAGCSNHAGIRPGTS